MWVMHCHTLCSESLGSDGLHCGQACSHSPTHTRVKWGHLGLPTRKHDQGVCTQAWHAVGEEEQECVHSFTSMWSEWCLSLPTQIS